MFYAYFRANYLKYYVWKQLESQLNIQLQLLVSEAIWIVKLDVRITLGNSMGSRNKLIRLSNYMLVTIFWEISQFVWGTHSYAKFSHSIRKKTYSKLGLQISLYSTSCYEVHPHALKGYCSLLSSSIFKTIQLKKIYNIPCIYTPTIDTQRFYFLS